MPDPVAAQAQQVKPPSNVGALGQGQTQVQGQPPTRHPPKAGSVGPTARPPQTPNAAHMQAGGHNRNSPNMNNMPAPPLPQASGGGAAPAATFFSARAVTRQPDAKEPGLVSNEAFNPKAESPSIRKTPGIDHTSSRPVGRSGQHVAPASSQSSEAPSSSATGFTPARQGSGPVTRASLANPSLDQTRRIGAPGGPGSPLANRGSYKPPTMKRPLPGDGSANSAANSAASGPRSPLVDLPANTNAQANPATGGGAAGDGLDAKRQKTA